MGNRNNSKQATIDRDLSFLAKSSIFLFFSLIFSKVLAYLYRVYIARTYGAEVYGMFALCLTVIGWFLMFGEFGLRQGNLRFIPIFRSRRRDSSFSCCFEGF
jgi:O-antigen/teichoic acid export membrane protein